MSSKSSNPLLLFSHRPNFDFVCFVLFNFKSHSLEKQMYVAYPVPATLLVQSSL